MNKIKIQELLKQWINLVNIGEQTSKTKAKTSTGGLQGRIKRTTGKPVIFDFDIYEAQQNIQILLCKELPQWADIIQSQPEIMNDYKWTRKDFIELYFEHFRMVIEKLQRIIDQPPVM